MSAEIVISSAAIFRDGRTRSKMRVRASVDAERSSESGAASRGGTSRARVEFVRYLRLTPESENEGKKETVRLVVRLKRRATESVRLVSV